MANPALASLPSVDKLLSSDAGRQLISKYGRQLTTRIIRETLDEIRHEVREGKAVVPDHEAILQRITSTIEPAGSGSIKTLLNLTGTVLHTNLGRASLPLSAIEAMVKVAASPANLEFDLESGERGDRDSHVEPLLTGITGAEAATVVNNNAAAVLLTLNTLAQGKEVPVSRGELVEIGGSFRIPDIMARSGCHLVETGTTNRTHLKDYERALGPRTGLLMKVHTSNYAIQGFTHAVTEHELADLAHANDLPLVTDLGSGTLVDLGHYDLPREPTVADALEAGADLVTFSGDKLLGGPQAGIIVGKRQYVEALKANPMKRALRVDKITLAALVAVLELYRDPDTLAERLPTLRLLTRPKEAITQTAMEVLPAMVEALDGIGLVETRDTNSQIGSGSLPLDLLPSVAIAITPHEGKGSDTRLRQIAAAFRHLDVPVIGRIHDGALLFDMRALENSAELTEQLPKLDLSGL